MHAKCSLWLRLYVNQHRTAQPLLDVPGQGGQARRRRQVAAEAETLVAELVAGELQSLDVGYVIVNEAGASVYSTSGYAREELPGHEAAVRGAISIGRRL